MTPNSAYSLVNIEQGKDYGIVDDNSPIFAIHCTQTNTEEVILVPISGDVEIKFPAGSFVQGAIYWIYVKKFITLGGGSFIGYLYQKKPYTL